MGRRVGRSAEGTWSSPGFRSARTRAALTQGLLIAVAVIAGVSVLQEWSGLPLIDRIAAGTALESEGTRFDAMMAGLAAWSLVIALATDVAFLAWLSRSVENAPPLGAGTPRTSPRWAIVWWFVPLANLVQPYRVVKELYARLAIDANGRDTYLVLVWWLAYLASVVVASFGGMVLSSVDSTPDGARTTLVLYGVGDALRVLAAVPAVLLVREIERRQRVRADRLGYPVRSSGAAWAGPATSVITCPACGSARVGGARRCASCGRDLAPFDAAAAAAQAGLGEVPSGDGGSGREPLQGPSSHRDPDPPPPGP